jgi:anthranilate phosphoribosyltransferase
MQFKDTLSALMRGRDLDARDMAYAMNQLIAGDYTDAQAAAFLVALSAKGESVVEIVAAARVLLRHATPISFLEPNIVDIVGTGGDGASTFNISTAAAFVAAAAGAKVVKHCGGSSTGKSGSSEVLESLGAAVDLSAEQSLKVFEGCGLVFLHAPRFNPAMARVAKMRKEIGTRTVFNLIGPLINPARPKRQVVGVYSHYIVENVALALRKLGSKYAYVVNGSPGVDELSVTGRTHGLWLRDGTLRQSELDPKYYGFHYDVKDEVRVETSEESAAVIRVSQGMLVMWWFSMLLRQFLCRI